MTRKVSRRRVLYIPGFDPVHPRRYRELYRTEGAAQAAISGYEIVLRPRRGGDRFGWHVSARIDGASVETEVEVLAWSDIVRDSMAGGVAATYRALLRTAWTYVGTGAFWRLMRLRKGPVIAALYPVGMLLLQLAIAVLIGWGCGRIAAAALGAVGAGVAVPWGGMAAGVAIAVVVLRRFKARDGKLYAHYLMQDYAFTARDRGAWPMVLEPRLELFADRIAAALASDADEVLVVGHSSGVHLAVPVLARLVREGRVKAGRPALSFLSLGQVVPMVSFLPGATALRADLRYLSEREEVTWVDVTAPGDGCAFALCDPVAVSGVAGPGKRWPLVISAAFSQTLGPERWRALRWRFFRLHFQYLCAFDRVGDYDYFRITAGPLTLAARFAGRAPSRSRIEDPVSKYRDMAA